MNVYRASFHTIQCASRKFASLRAVTQHAAKHAKSYGSTTAAATKSTESNGIDAIAKINVDSPILLEAYFHKVADETLEEILDYVTILEEKDIDVDTSLAQGVLKLTINNVEDEPRHWVINKQTPNRQIWWSSPISGPRRYEYNSSLSSADNRCTRWVYTRDNINLYDTLRSEIKAVTGLMIDEPK